MSTPHRTPEIIDGKVVKSLVEAQAIRGAIVLGQPGGFAVLVKYGLNERAIAAQRSRHMRLWRNLNTAAAYVRNELGISRFEIDMSDLDPNAIERKRPDTAKRQRKLHEAAEHNIWFQTQVKNALKGLRDGTNPLINEEEWKKIAERKRSDLQQKILEEGR